MSLKVLYLNNDNDKCTYQNILKNVDQKNPYSSLAFLQIFADGLSDAVCFYVQYDDAVIYLPGYLRSIPDGDGLVDFISPYGYSGPSMSSDVSEQQLMAFWHQVDIWHRENKVVSEFVRFSLNGNSAGYTGEVINTMSNIKGLIIREEEQWRNFDKKVRKNVKRAKSENLFIMICNGNEITDELLLLFHDIYIKTMERTNANAKFFYSLAEFRCFIDSNPELCAFAFVMDEGVCVSTEMLLISEDSIYSFLGGTLEEYFHKRPNDFLKYEVINWARKNNIKYFVMGGGYGADDGIFKYKKSFFPDNVVTYKTGRKIVDHSKYKFLVESAFGESLPEDVREIEQTFFPLYRAQLKL